MCYSTGNMAGPHALTPEKLTKLCNYIELGLSRSVAAEKSGVGERNLRNYLTKGQEEDAHEGYREIWTRVKMAEAEALGTLEEAWYTQAKLDWRAAERLLRARLPEVYGDRQAVEISGPGGGPVQSISLQEHVDALRQGFFGVKPKPTSKPVFGLGSSEGWDREPDPDSDAD